jgi:hypothetical protein
MEEEGGEKEDEEDDGWERVPGPAAEFPDEKSREDCGGRMGREVGGGT